MKKLLAKTWFQIIAFGIVIGAGLILLDNQFDFFNANVKTVSTYNGPVTIEKDKTYFTQASLNETSVDFGKVKEGDTLSHVFKISNTGNEPLFIYKTSGSCDCAERLEGLLQLTARADAGVAEHGAGGERSGWSRSCVSQSLGDRAGAVSCGQLARSGAVRAPPSRCAPSSRSSAAWCWLNVYRWTPGAPPSRTPLTRSTLARMPRRWRSSSSSAEPSRSSRSLRHRDAGQLLHAQQPGRVGGRDDARDDRDGDAGLPGLRHDTEVVLRVEEHLRDREVGAGLLLGQQRGDVLRAGAARRVRCRAGTPRPRPTAGAPAPGPPATGCPRTAAPRSPAAARPARPRSGGRRGAPASRSGRWAGRRAGRGTTAGPRRGTPRRSW